MSKSPDRRILGLSPRARRVVVPVLAITAVLVVLAYFSGDRSGEAAGAGRIVGGRLPVAGDPETRIVEDGHGGPGHRADAGRWAQLGSLDADHAIGSTPFASKVPAAGRAEGERR